MSNRVQSTEHVDWWNDAVNQVTMAEADSITVEEEANRNWLGDVDLTSLRAVLQAQQPTASLEVWRDVLEAIKVQVRPTKESPTTGKSTAAGHTSTGSRVTEFIAALDALDVMLKRDIEARQALERQLCAARAQLDRMGAELLASRVRERRARQLALHDGLTALPNRSFFLERLDEALHYAREQCCALAVLYLDLDGFKPVNDTHGHAVGDELLKIVASRLARALRTKDIVSRLGGDEFACLLADFPSRARLRRLAYKLFDTVTAPCKIGAFTLSVRASIGVAVYPADGETVERLLAHADSAMYFAKRAGRGVAFFEQRSMLQGAGKAQGWPQP